MPLDSTFATDRPTVPKPTMATLSGPSTRPARSGRASEAACGIVSVFCIRSLLVAGPLHTAPLRGFVLPLVLLTLLPRLDRHRIEEGHHAAQLRADLLDRMLLLGRARLVELRTACFVLLDPLRREGAVLDLVEQLLHRLARFRGHDARPGDVVAVLSRVAD